MKTRPVKTIGQCLEDIKSATIAVTAVRNHFGTLTDLTALLSLTDEQIQDAPILNDYRIDFFCEGCAAGLLKEYPPHHLEEYRAFLNQLLAMQMESWGRTVEGVDNLTVDLWAGYWEMMCKKFGGWDNAKKAVKEQFKGLEGVYGEILNQSYKKAKQ